MSSKPDTVGHGKRNLLSRAFNKFRRAPRPHEAASTSTQPSSSVLQASDRPVDERSTITGGDTGALQDPPLTLTSQLPAIQIEDHSKHNYGDTYNTHGTANFVGSVANASFGTNTVTTIEQAFFSSGTEATLLWDTLPKQRDIGGQENEYLEGSREDTVQDVLGWFEDHDSELSLSIQGAAGLGKSTLARHLAHRFHAVGRLAASVSLKALSSDARSPTSVVKMVSREIGRTHPTVIPAILEAIRSCEAAPLVNQIEMFLVGPIRSLSLSYPLAVIFDAVDEYEFHEVLVKALSSLPPSSPIKIILLSRSGPRGRGFTEGSIRPYLLQPVSNSVMERFLSRQFDDVHWEHGRRSAQMRITTLAELANGLFIWATVVCSLLRKRSSRFSSENILDSILDARRSLGDSEQLATLYHQVITLLFPEVDDQDLFREYLTATVALQEPLPIDGFSAFANLPIRAIESIHTELKALQITQPEDPAMVYPARRIFHLSILEYLHSTSTPPHIAFHISLFDAHSKLAEYCLMELPRFLPSPHRLSYLDLSPRQRYTVCYLMTHLHHGTPSVQPGSAEDWECSLHYSLLLQTSPELLEQWEDLFVDLVDTPPAMEEWAEGADTEDTGSDVEDIDGGERSDYHEREVGGQDTGSEGADNENSREGSVDIVDAGNQDAHEGDWGHGTWVSQLLRDVAWTLDGDGYTARTPFQICCLGVAVRLRPNHVELWRRLGRAYLNAAGWTLSVNACDQAVEAFQNALRGADEPGACDPGGVLTDLATALTSRFNLVGRAEDLHRAIALHRDGLTMRPPGHINRTMSLNNLAFSLGTYLRQIGPFGGGMDEVISLQKEALDQLPQGDKNMALCLRNLALHLRCRYDTTTSTADLEEAIQLRRKSLALCPPGHPDRARALSGLAWDLTWQYEVVGGSRHLEEAIRLGRESLPLFPVGRPSYPMAMGTLAMALRHKQEHLDEALGLSRASVSLIPAIYPLRWQALRSLATILLCHHERSGKLEGLEEATSVCEEALALCPPSHPRRHKLLALQAKLAEARSLSLSSP